MNRYSDRSARATIRPSPAAPDAYLPAAIPWSVGQYRRCVFVLGCVLALFATAPAGAAGSPSSHRDDLSRTARKACLSGDYKTGVEILSDLFLDTKDPTHIFNQGRCFEQGGQWSEAIRRFQEYVRANKKITPAGKADAERHIGECQEMLAKESQAAQAGNSQGNTQPILERAPQQPPPFPSSLPVQPSTTLVQPIPSTSGGQSLRTAGILTAGAGAAFIAAGVVLNLKANSMSSDLERHYTKSEDSRRETYKTLSQVGYVTGGICTVAGAVLYYLGWSRGQGSAGRVAVSPAFSASRAGLSIEGAF